MLLCWVGFLAGLASGSPTASMLDNARVLAGGRVGAEGGGGFGRGRERGLLPYFPADLVSAAP